MKRDMDLVRKIMIAAEDAEGAPDLSSLIAEFGENVVRHHSYLINQAGLAEGICPGGGELDWDGSPPICVITGLTWAGHDFIVAARNDTLWAKAKAKAITVIGGMTIDALKAALTLAAKEAIGGDGLDL